MRAAHVSSRPRVSQGPGFMGFRRCSCPCLSLAFSARCCQRCCQDALAPRGLGVVRLLSECLPWETPLAEVGLRLDRWLDSDRRWVAAVPAN